MKIKSILLAISILIAFSSFGSGNYSGQPECLAALAEIELEVGTDYGAEFFNGFKALSKEEFPGTTGIEIEGSIRKVFEFEDVIEFANEYIPKRFPHLKSVGQGFEKNGGVSSTFFDGDKTFTYRVLRDPSIMPKSNRQRGAELVSPVFYNEPNKREFLEFFKVMAEKFDFVAEKETAGVHVHVGYPKRNTKQLAALLKVFRGIEEELKDFFAVEDGRFKSTGPVSTQLINDLNSFRDPEDQDAIETLLSFYDGKMFGLNVLGTPNSENGYTIEYRIFNSHMDPVHLDFYLEFCLRLTRAVLMKEPQFMQFLKGKAGKRSLDLVGLGHVLGLDFSENSSIYKSLHKKARSWNQLRELLN